MTGGRSDTLTVLLAASLILLGHCWSTSVDAQGNIAEESVHVANTVHVRREDTVKAAPLIRREVSRVEAPKAALIQEHAAATTVGQEVGGEAGNTSLLARGAATAKTGNHVVSGPCTIDLSMTNTNGCALSPNWPAPYGHNSHCVIAFAGTISAVGYSFNVESQWDTLSVINYDYTHRYWGTRNRNGPPIGTVITAGSRANSGSLVWAADGSVSKSGWRLCLEAVASGKAKCDSLTCEAGMVNRGSGVECAGTTCSLAADLYTCCQEAPQPAPAPPAAPQAAASQATSCLNAEVFVTSHDNKQLEDRVGTVDVHADKGDWQKWTITDAGGNKVFMTSHRNQQLEDRHGTVDVHADKGDWQKWTITNAGGNKVFMTSHRNQQLEDRVGTVRVHADRGDWQKWTIATTSNGPCPSDAFQPQAR